RGAARTVRRAGAEAVRLRLGVAGTARGRRPGARGHLQRGHAADRQRHPAAGLRHLGARLLHRLPQRAGEVPGGVLEPGRLGLRGVEPEEVAGLNAGGAGGWGLEKLFTLAPFGKGGMGDLPLAEPRRKARCFRRSYRDGSRSLATTGATCAWRPSASPMRSSTCASSAVESVRTVAWPTLRPGRGDLP